MLLLDSTSDLGIPKIILGKPNKFFGSPKIFPMEQYTKLLAQLPQDFLALHYL
jgi:hypothetical protein